MSKFRVLMPNRAEDTIEADDYIVLPSGALQFFCVVGGDPKKVCTLSPQAWLIVELAK